MPTETNQTCAQKFILEAISVKNDSAFLRSSYEVYGDLYGDYIEYPDYADYTDLS